MDAEGKEHAFPRLPTKDLEMAALPIRACRVGCKTEVVAGVLGKDGLDPQGTLGQDLQPGMEGGGCHEDQQPSEALGGAGPWWCLLCPWLSW